MFTERLKSRKTLFLISIITSIVLISYFHYSAIPKLHNLHNIFTELFYIPLVLAALVFGLKGALLAFMFVMLSYTPYIIMNWSSDFSFIANKLLHAVLGGALAVLSGYLVDRERGHRLQLEKDRYLAGVGQAAAAIVHDLKNPLIAILGFAKRIRQGKGDITTASQAVIDSAEDMQLIVRDVLDFAKPIRLDLKEVDAGGLISKACLLCKKKADDKGLVLSVDLPSHPVTLTLDRLHMERALINIINNSIEASGSGGTIIVRFDMNEYSIIIKDHGEGMDKETLENVFIPFYTKKRSGTGLGMAIAKKVIDGHKGKININSHPGLGTEITIILPVS